MKYRKMKNQGVVAVFQRDRFDRYSNFARIGEGSLGGKGRGLAFIDNMVKRHVEFDEFEKDVYKRQDLLVSIIKLIEDKMNLELDIKEVGVQMILLVEDSIRFYSSVLPNLRCV